MGPAAGATASPVSALLMLRIRAGPAGADLAPRFRQVIHMYCVQICSSARSCKSLSRANVREFLRA